MKKTILTLSAAAFLLGGTGLASASDSIERAFERQGFRDVEVRRGVFGTTVEADRNGRTHKFRIGHGSNRAVFAGYDDDDDRGSWSDRDDDDDDRDDDDDDDDRDDDDRDDRDDDRDDRDDDDDDD